MKIFSGYKQYFTDLPEDRNTDGTRFKDGLATSLNPWLVLCTTSLCFIRNSCVEPFPVNVMILASGALGSHLLTRLGPSGWDSNPHKKKLQTVCFLSLGLLPS